MKKSSIKNRIIAMLIAFSMIVISTIVGLLYLNLFHTVNDFNKSIIKSSEKTVQDRLEKSKVEGRKIILSSNNKVVNFTKDKLNGFIKKSSKDNNSIFLKLFSESINMELELKEKEIRNSVNAPVFWWEKESSARNILDKLLKKDGIYEGFMVFGETRDPFFDTGKIQENFNINSIAKKIKKDGIYYSKLDKENRILLGLPIINDEKKNKGYIMASLNIKKLLDKRFTDLDLGIDRAIFAARKNKKIIKHQNSSYEGKRFTAVKYSDKKKFQQIVNSNAIFNIYKFKLIDDEVFLVIKEYISDTFSYVDELKKAAETTINKSFDAFDKELELQADKSYEITKEVASKKMKSFQRDMINIIYFVIVLGILIAILLGILLGNYISKPIKELSYAAKRIGEGELTYEIDKKLLKRSDELGALAVEFSDMKNKLNGDIERIRDLERKKAQGERLSMMGQMVSGIVHEIKNPLTSISGFAQIIEEMSENPLMKNHSKIIIEETDRLNKLAKELLNYAKAGKIEKERIRIKPHIESVVDRLSPDIREKNINVNINIPENIPVVYGDKDKMLQVFINIIGNAIEAMKKSNGLIEITGIRDGEFVLLKFKNNGPSIPEEIKSKIFQPFVSNKKGGTGLGLAMVKKIVEDHNGEINLGEDPEGRTEFIISLPIKKDF